MKLLSPTEINVVTLESLRIKLSTLSGTFLWTQHSCLTIIPENASFDCMIDHTVPQRLTLVAITTAPNLARAFIETV